MKMLKRIAKNFKRTGGFTLAELVVTTAVMGTLAAVAVPRFSDVNEIAKERKTMANIDNVMSAAQNYYSDMTVRVGRGRFPGQNRFDDPVAETSVFYSDDDTFNHLFGDNVVDSPYEEAQYRFMVSPGSGSGQKAVSPTITVWDDEDKEEPKTLIKSYTP
ncbi:MAG: type II secretion system protein [Candidatus Neomarinimicrobiota bacterium]